MPVRGQTVSTPMAHLASLTDEDRRLLEAWLVEFDLSWDEERLATRAATVPSGHPLRRAALVEMVKIDLERQWQRGRPCGLEDYLRVYPELAEPDGVPPDLIEAEREVRRQFGDTVADLSLPPGATPARQSLRPLPQPFGRYRIVKILGSGGMGAVYLAHDTQLDRPVALKVPHLDPLGGPEVLERFLREGRAAANLDHPHLCRVYDAGCQDGVPYLTMAYVEGRPLSDLTAAGPAAADWAADLVRQVALAVGHAHARGVIHRDLKPSNVLLTAGGEPVVTDFGLSRRAVAEDIRLTPSGALLGTPAYMAPEQVTGAPVGPAADVYSLGVVLYELLTGRLPFPGSVGEVLAGVVHGTLTPPSAHRPGLDPRLERACLKALARAPGDRYATMADFAAALAPRRQAPGRGANWPRRLALAAGLTAALGGLAWLAWLAWPESRSSDAGGLPSATDREASGPVQPGRAVLEGHTTRVTSLAFSADGKWLASGADDPGPVIVWDVAGGRKRGHLEHAAVRALAFSPDGRTLASGADTSGSALKLWDVAGGPGPCLHEDIPGGCVSALAFSSDGSQLVAGWRDNAVQVWDADKHAPLRTQPTGGGAVLAVACGPGGRVAFGREQRWVQVGPLAGGEWAHQFKMDGAVWAVAFLEDNRLSAACIDYPGKVLWKSWDLRSGEELKHADCHREGRATMAALSPDGRFLATGDKAGLVQVWRLPAGELLGSFEGHRKRVTALAFSPDGRLLASGSEDTTVRLWDLSGLK
jgi:hypothetical protein